MNDQIENITRNERTGLAEVEKIPDADLFFVDNAQTTDIAAPEPFLSRKRRNRSKILRSQIILQDAQTAKLAFKPGPRCRNQKQQATNSISQRTKIVLHTKVSQQKSTEEDIWNADDGNPKKKAKAKDTKISHQIDIDLPGCSYNPDPEIHQEAIAVAVAAEMQKIYAKDLLPLAPPTFIDMRDHNEGDSKEEDELELLQTAAEEDVDQEEEEDDVTVKVGKSKKGKKTEKERKKEQKKKEMRIEEGRKKAEKARIRELSDLKSIKKQIEVEVKEKEERSLRKKLDRAERAASQPPKLGRYRFEPMPVQVLTTDEVAGSLRVLKPTAMLVKERFKSFQKRGVIEPRRPVNKKTNKRVSYQTGDRAERAAARQTEIHQLKTQRKLQSKT